MNKRKEYERMYCHKDFKKMLKIESTNMGFKNVLEYTKHIAHKNSDVIEEVVNAKKKKWKFNL
jgi:hypothetical protein